MMKPSNRVSFDHLNVAVPAHRDGSYQRQRHRGLDCSWLRGKQADYDVVCR